MRNIMALILSLASMLGYSDIPLFVKNVGDHINRSRVGNWNGTNMVFRYDFVKGDYLPPDGKGEIAIRESRIWRRLMSIIRTAAALSSSTTSIRHLSTVTSNGTWRTISVRAHVCSGNFSRM